MTKRNKHIGSSLEDFLKEEGIFEEARTVVSTEDGDNFRVRHNTSRSTSSLPRLDCPSHGAPYRRHSASSPSEALVAQYLCPIK